MSLHVQHQLAYSASKYKVNAAGAMMVVAKTHLVSSATAAQASAKARESRSSRPSSMVAPPASLLTAGRAAAAAASGVVEPRNLPLLPAAGWLKVRSDAAEANLQLHLMRCMGVHACALADGSAAAPRLGLCNRQAIPNTLPKSDRHSGSSKQHATTVLFGAVFHRTLEPA
jgi:hypothetical protein